MIKNEVAGIVPGCSLSLPRVKEDCSRAYCMEKHVTERKIAEFFLTWHPKGSSLTAHY